MNFLNHSKLVLKTAIAAAAVVCAGLASAQQADPGMLATLKKLYPNTTFKEVNRTVVPGVFEVIMGQNVAYVEESGRYFMFGRMFDMQTQQDLTAAKLENVNKVDVSKLPKEDAIKKVKGDGSRTMYVFSDPDCPYCKQLEQNLKGLNNVTIYTFPYPLEGLHPDAKRKSIGVWCSSDKVAAWDDLMLNGKPAANGNCDHPVDRNIKLGQQLGATGTPTLFAADGRKLPGAASAEKIDQWLDGAN